MDLLRIGCRKHLDDSRFNVDRGCHNEAITRTALVIPDRGSSLALLPAPYLMLVQFLLLAPALPSLCSGDMVGF